MMSLLISFDPILQKASYLAEEQGLDVTDAIVNELSKHGYNNQT